MLDCDHCMIVACLQASQCLAYALIIEIIHACGKKHPWATRNQSVPGAGPKLAAAYSVDGTVRSASTLQVSNENPSSSCQFAPITVESA